MIDAAYRQPNPTEGKQDVAAVVAVYLKARGMVGLAQDIESRVLSGEKKYGSRLKTFNGRDVFLDLLQECEDGMNYAMQAHLEGKEVPLVDGAATPFDVFETLVQVASRVRTWWENAQEQTNQNIGTA